ncbi:hypothetical protein [Saccharopolyspora taberi]|uniref:Uncharacterized protein n=1 Tax=Saccharopolyspora taberi TaxID=60895 RepID=A0ABN3VBL9_9PSEU
MRLELPGAVGGVDPGSGSAAFIAGPDSTPLSPNASDGRVGDAEPGQRDS